MNDQLSFSCLHRRGPVTAAALFVVVDNDRRAIRVISHILLAFERDTDGLVRVSLALELHSFPILVIGSQCLTQHNNFLFNDLSEVLKDI